MKFTRRTSKLHRFVDRYAGIPLIFLPSLYRKAREIPSDIKRICIIKTSGIGDTVLLSAVVKDILKHYHGCSITVLTGVDNHLAGKFLLGRLSDKIELRVADFRDFDSIAELRHMKEFDLTIDFGQWPRFDAFLSILTKSRFRVGFSRGGQHRHYGYDLSVVHRSDRHELNNFRALAESLGVVCLYDTGIDDVYSLEDVPENTVTIHMCPSGTTAMHRMWPMEKWAELVRKLDEKGYEVIFSGRYIERDYIDAVAGFAGLPYCRMMLDRHFEELIPVLKGSRFVISVDTGIAHLASACGARLIELLGPTNPDRWGALGDNVTYVRPENVGKMLDLGNEKDVDKDAMKRITVNQILQYII
ncbi:MAG: hypothetical protein C0602_09235 [Denitrovibrio sp.]|nr:MAG: hypothetical protein C0602_09235 [Denitrovibrio sp.]